MLPGITRISSRCVRTLMLARVRSAAPSAGSTRRRREARPRGTRRPVRISRSPTEELVAQTAMLVGAQDVGPGAAERRCGPKAHLRRGRTGG